MTKAKTETRNAAGASSTSTADFDALELVALARADIEQNRLDKALAKLKQALTREDVPADAYAVTARLYAQLGLYDRAKGLFERYLAQDPGAVLETFQLGMTHYDAGELDQALGVWDELLAEQPVHPPALFYKGLVLAQSGQPVDALQALDVLLKSAPTDNLYFERAKELKQAIDRNGQTPVAGAPIGAAAPGTPRDAYKTEH